MATGGAARLSNHAKDPESAHAERDGLIRVQEGHFGKQSLGQEDTPALLQSSHSALSTLFTSPVKVLLRQKCVGVIHDDG